jgi:hypothetical protein
MHLVLDDNSQRLISEYQDNGEQYTPDIDMGQGDNPLDTQPESGQMDGAEGLDDVPEGLRKDVAFAHALLDVIGSRYIFRTLPIPLPS